MKKMIKYPKKRKPKDMPPKTIRYCPVCEEKTEFKYDSCIGHSECEECGFHEVKI